MVEYESRHEPAPVDMKPMVDVGISEVCDATILECFCLSCQQFLRFLCMKPQLSFQSSLECEFLQAGVKFVSWLLEKQEAWRPSSEEAGQVVPSATMRSKKTLFRVEAQKEMNWPEVAQPDGYVTSMIGFSKKSTFSKAVYLCAASQLDTSKLDGLNEMFHKLDVDRRLAGRLPRYSFGLF